MSDDARVSDPSPVPGVLQDLFPEGAQNPEGPPMEAVGQPLFLGVEHEPSASHSNELNAGAFANVDAWRSTSVQSPTLGQLDHDVDITNKTLKIVVQKLEGLEGEMAGLRTEMRNGFEGMKSAIQELRSAIQELNASLR